MTRPSVHQRAEAIGVMVGDAVSQAALENVELVDSVYKSDLASVFRELTDMRAMVVALAQSVGELLVENRKLREEVQAWRGGIAVELGGLTERVVGLEART